MPLKPSVRLKLREESTFEKALPIAGEIKLSDIAHEIAQLPKLVTDHAVTGSSVTAASGSGWGDEVVVQLLAAGFSLQW